MKLAVRWLLITAGFILGAVGIFSLYSRFALDYSLNNLEYALSVAKKAPDISSPVVQSVYKRMVDDITMEESGREDPDIRNLVLLDTASMSFGEAKERAGYERASVYLSDVIGAQLTNRPFLLRVADQIFYLGIELYRSLRSFVHYVHRKLFKPQDQGNQAYTYSSILLLTQAEEEQQKGNLPRAAELYQRYLDFYPAQSESGFVAIALAYVSIRMENFPHAEKILKKVRTDYAGNEEERIADVLLARINSIKDRKHMIRQLRKLSEDTEDGLLKQQLQFKMALAYLATYQMQEAEVLLLQLKETAEDAGIRQQAQFYLGWLYKRNLNLDQSAETFAELLATPDLLPSLEIGTRAEIASLYYLERRSPEAAEAYELVSQNVEKVLSSLDVARQAWVSLGEAQRLRLYKGWKSIAEVEQAQINLLDLGDKRKAEQNLSQLQEIGRDVNDLSLLRHGLTEATNASLRDRAFDALKKGRIHAAYSMFLRNAELFPRDAWTFSGLATVYLILADLEIAHQHAAQGYRFKADEYTASVLAYVKGFRGDRDAAVGFYNEAIQRNSGYIPAQFNLGCLYLEQKEYQKALKIFDGLLNQTDSNKEYLRAKVLNNLGYAYWFLGDKGAAGRYFEQAVDLSPDMILARTNLQQFKLDAAPQMVGHQDG